MNPTDVQPDDVFFWVGPQDPRGNPVDQTFIVAAKAKIKAIKFYRANELRDEAVRANLVEAAIYRSSRASRDRPVDDPAGYVYTTFKRLVDEWLTRDHRVEYKPVDELDRIAGPGVLGEAETKVLRREALQALDKVSGYACARRAAGYEVNEIAGELKMSPDSLSARLRKATSSLRLRFGSRPQNKRQ